MKIIKFLNSCLSLGQTWQQALIAVEERYGIKNSYNEKYGLWVLNYDQIKSSKHKFEQIVCECRSLVVDYDGEKFNVVSRAFDRFFNHGEKKIPHTVDKLTAYEKMDGSLVSVFYYKGDWLYRTKSMIMPETEINGLGVTWKEVIEEALGDKWLQDCEDFRHRLVDHDRSFTFIFEVCSPENRVVTRYQGRTATLLAVRHNVAGHYVAESELNYEHVCNKYGWNRPLIWTFETWEDCLTVAKELRNLEEGFVMYNKKGQPMCKVKNPAYVAAHHLRGEGVLTPKRVVDLILMNELDEYLSIFPEDTDAFTPYLHAYGSMVTDIKMRHRLLSTEGKHFIESQKEFALEIQGLPCASILFKMRRNKELTLNEAFDKLTRKSQQTMIEAYLQGERL